jgi:hypothetical protein
MIMKSLSLMCFAALIICGSCQYDPYAHLYTTQKPRPQDLVGRYKLKQQTVTTDGLSALAGRLSVVELAADGSFLASNVPPRASLSVAPEAGGSIIGRLLNGSGRWRVGAVGGVDNGLGERTHWGVYFDSTASDIAPVGLTGARPPYGLIFTLGDPDLGTAMIFERQN